MTLTTGVVMSLPGLLSSFASRAVLL